jgi:erythromycin esterase-like protein
MGHIKSSDVRTVMIPKGSLTDTASNGVANVLTSIGFNATTGAITTTHENVGTLILTGYNLGTDTGAVANTDTVSAAMSKLQAQINKEVNDRALAITNTVADAASKANTAESNAKTYAYGLIAALDVTDAAVASKYVSAVNEVDGKVVVSRADLPTYTLTTGDTNGTVKFNSNEVAVAGLGTAAYTSSDSYATAA